MDYIRYCLSNNLRQRRITLQISQEDLAHRSGVSPGFIANLETGRNFPSSEILLRIASVLQIEPYKLLMDPERQDVVYTQEEILQWIKESAAHLLDRDHAEKLYEDLGSPGTEPDTMEPGDDVAAEPYPDFTESDDEHG